MNKERIEKGNLELAKILGWFQQPDQTEGVWWKRMDSANYIVYQQKDDKNGELPFHKDWNYLQQARQAVVMATGKKISDVSMNYLDSHDYEVNVATLRDYNWQWDNHELIGNMTPIELMFLVVSELAEVYNKQNA